MIPEGARVAHRASHEWLVPRRAVVGILAFSCAFLLVGVVLLAIGAGRNVGITALGAILTGLGGTGITLCVLLCLYAYCVWYVKDEGTQTGDTPVTVSTDFEIPTYATVQKPSSLKNQDASLRRNGKPPIAKYPLDDDYDNPAEHSPMLISSPQQQRSAYQAHQQKSGFQQKTSFQTQQQQKSFQSQQQQQQQKTSMWRGGAADDVPEPQPLQYPSARRPMTFEQTSSSKMSIYDNVLFPHQE